MTRNTDLTNILKKDHENKWVALTEDRTKVVGCSETLIKLQEEVGTKKVVYMKVLPSDVSFAF